MLALTAMMEDSNIVRWLLARLIPPDGWSALALAWSAGSDLVVAAAAASGGNLTAYRVVQQVTPILFVRKPA